MPPLTELVQGVARVTRTPRVKRDFSKQIILEGVRGDRAVRIGSADTLDEAMEMALGQRNTWKTAFERWDDPNDPEFIGFITQLGFDDIEHSIKEDPDFEWGDFGDPGFDQINLLRNSNFQQADIPEYLEKQGDIEAKLAERLAKRKQRRSLPAVPLLAGGGFMTAGMFPREAQAQTPADRFDFESLFTTPQGEDLPNDTPGDDRVDRALQARAESYQRADDLNWLVEGSGLPLERQKALPGTAGGRRTLMPLCGA